MTHRGTYAVICTEPATKAALRAWENGDPALAGTLLALHWPTHLGFRKEALELIVAMGTKSPLGDAEASKGLLRVFQAVFGWAPAYAIRLHAVSRVDLSDEITDWVTSTCLSLRWFLHECRIAGYSEDELRRRIVDFSASAELADLGDEIQVLMPSSGLLSGLDGVVKLVFTRCLFSLFDVRPPTRVISRWEGSCDGQVRTGR